MRSYKTVRSLLITEHCSLLSVSHSGSASLASCRNTSRTSLSHCSSHNLHPFEFDDSVFDFLDIPSLELDLEPYPELSNQDLLDSCCSSITLEESERPVSPSIASPLLFSFPLPCNILDIDQATLDPAMVTADCTLKQIAKDNDMSRRVNDPWMQDLVTHGRRSDFRGEHEYHPVCTRHRRAS